MPESLGSKIVNLSGIPSYLKDRKQKEVKLREDIADASKSYGKISSMPFEDEPDKVRRLYLEKLYKCDEVIFSIVILYKKSIPKIDRLECYFNGDRIKSIEDRLNVWKNIVKLSKKASKTLEYAVLYGDCWTEDIYNDDMKIVGVRILDSKNIDYKRNNDGKIEWDYETGKPLGIVQYIPSDIIYDKEKLGGREVVSQNPSEPKFLEGDSDAILLESNTDEMLSEARQLKKRRYKKITHYKLHTIGDGLFGIGLVEPSYYITRHKLNVFEGFSQFALRMGYGMIGVPVGDKDKMPKPNPTEIEKAGKAFENVDARKVISYPWYWNPENLFSPKGKVDFTPNLNFFVNQQITASQAPSPFITGFAGDSPRAALEVQLTMFFKGIKDYQDIYEETLCEGTLKRVLFSILIDEGDKDVEKELNEKLKNYPKLSSEEILDLLKIKIIWDESEQAIANQIKLITEYMKAIQEYAKLKQEFPDLIIEEEIRKIKELK